MALIVTPGAEDAESYLSVAEFKAYCDAVGYSYSSASDTQIEQALRRGARWLDGSYGRRFIGLPTEAGQALEWPRTGAEYRGSELPDDAIPKRIKDACAEAAFAEMGEPGSLAPSYTPGKELKQETIGPLSFTYHGHGTAADARPVLLPIEDLLLGLIRPATKPLFGEIARS